MPAPMMTTRGVEDMALLLTTGGGGELEGRFEQRMWFRLQAARVGASGRVVVTHTDITERVRDQEALAWRASHDDLTGLPNRARLLQLIGEALADGRGRAALLFLDLDGFKTVNDSLGHEVGRSEEHTSELPVTPI